MRMLQPALLTTSSKSDVIRSGGKLAITGLKEVSLSDVLSVEHRLYRAEVAQVFTIGGTTDPTITASTRYIVKIGYPYLDGTEGKESSLITFSHTSPATLSGTAATDRQNVYDALAAKINANTELPVTASAGSGGTAMTITDDGDYYAARPAHPRGKNTVLLSPDSTGGGFDNALHLEETTSAVYSFGEGTRLAQDAPVIDPLTGTLVSGEWEGPSTTAVAGQQYDGWFITSLTLATHNAISGLTAYGYTRQLVYCDNGAGTSTANAAGYAAFRREMDRVVYGFYANDPNSMVDLLDQPVFGTSKAAVDGVPTGATGDENAIFTGATIIEQHILGAGQTKIMPTWSTAGLQLDLDAADNEGAEYSAPIEAVSPQEFVVGQEEFSFFAEVTIDDVSDTDDCAFGFRLKEAYQANVDSYNDFAMLNVIAGDINIETNLNGAGTTTTDTTDNFGDGETHTLEVRVDLDGAVTYLIDDAAPTTTAAFTFDAGDTLIPFAYVLNAANSAPGVVVSKWYSIGDVLDR